MIRLLYSLLLISSFVQSARAENVGIDFAKMKVGTTIITETLDSEPRRLEEKFLGKEGEFFVMQERQSRRGEPMVKSGKVFYDNEGRRVKVKASAASDITHPTLACLSAVNAHMKSITQTPSPRSELNRAVAIAIAWRETLSLSLGN